MTTAKHYAQDVIDKAKYSFQMERSKEIHVNIDGAQCGVGGNDSWGATPLKPYILGTKPRSYRFRMIPVENARKIDGKVANRPKVFLVERGVKDEKWQIHSIANFVFNN